MSKFAKSDFNFDGMYLTYGTARRFVARFKHRGPFTKARFIKELIRSHTVESYFAELDAGKAPLEILRDANEHWYYGILEAFSGRSLR
jgi:hypothetical protein